MFSVTSVNISVISLWLVSFSSANMIILCMFLEYSALLEITAPALKEKPCHFIKCHTVTEHVAQTAELSDKLQWTNEKISKLKSSHQIKSKAK